MAKKNTPWLSLPSNELVALWQQKLNFWGVTPHTPQLYNLENYKKLAYKNYCEINKDLFDNELAKIICESINWQALEFENNSCGARPAENLGDNVFILDLPVAYNTIANIKDFIDKQFLNLELFSPMQLLAWSVFSRSKVIYIPKNFVSHKILNLNSIFYANNLQERATVIENIIFFIESGANVTVYNNLNNSGAVSAPVLIRNTLGYLGPNAKLNLIVDQHNSDNIYINYEEWFINNNSELNILHGITGNKNFEFKKYNLLSEYASVDYKVLTSLNSKDQVVLVTEQNHLAAKTKSNVNVKSALESDSKLFYRGTININAHAIKSDSNQQQISLMLGANAINCAIPSLEIKTDDVKCCHGSAVSKISEDHLWNLQSRGLEKTVAKKLIVDGFFDSYLTDFEPALTTSILSRIKNRSIATQ